MVVPFAVLLCLKSDWIIFVECSANFMLQLIASERHIGRYQEPNMT